MKYSARFWMKVRVAPADSCWQWMAVLSKGGYGQFRLDGGMRQAHRVAYRLSVGPIPEGLELDHLCRNRACVNPAHLEPVTKVENWRRGVSPAALHALQTHCSKGHPFDEANTYRRTSGKRACRKCTNAAQIRYQKRKQSLRELED